MIINQTPIVTGDRLSEQVVNEIHRYYGFILRDLKQEFDFEQAWFNCSPESEAGYFVLKTKDITIKFSIRNHKSWACRRQFNFYIDDYSTLKQLRKKVLEYVREEMRFDK